MQERLTDKELLELLDELEAGDIAVEDAVNPDDLEWPRCWLIPSARVRVRRIADQTGIRLDVDDVIGGGALWLVEQGFYSSGDADVEAWPMLASYAASRGAYALLKRTAYMPERKENESEADYWRRVRNGGYGYNAKTQKPLPSIDRCSITPSYQQDACEQASAREATASVLTIAVKHGHAEWAAEAATLLADYAEPCRSNRVYTA